MCVSSPDRLLTKDDQTIVSHFSPVTTKAEEETAETVEGYITKIFRRDVSSAPPSSCQTSSEQQNEAWPVDEECEVESKSPGVGYLVLARIQK